MTGSFPDYAPARRLGPAKGFPPGAIILLNKATLSPDLRMQLGTRRPFAYIIDSEAEAGTDERSGGKIPSRGDRRRRFWRVGNRVPACRRAGDDHHHRPPQ